MDREEAAVVAERVVGRLREQSYQVEIQARWDSGQPPDLRVIVGVDDGGLRSSFWPVDRTFIITSDGSFIGE
jgi:hypothetical protein